MKCTKIVVVVYFAQPEIRTIIESVRDTFHHSLQIRTVQHFIQKIILKNYIQPTNMLIMNTNVNVALI